VRLLTGKANDKCIPFAIQVLVGARRQIQIYAGHAKVAPIRLAQASWFKVKRYERRD